ncbi:unnamed protein product [Didymodactylos carnosus]|uniref:Ankyrin repeat protein n=1 Tax=Didymodactylos carnosus TaxID=1234261 RepID=A0A815USF5_9BILA|nr:unnamed protein product [Didymodactylos carnosus]CAF4385955.1 unnamed protein product [Didymodactylos carnosus]
MTEHGIKFVVSWTFDHFYQAYFKNDIINVKKWLVSMNIDDLNTVGLDGNTALHIASRQGHFKIVLLLLEHHVSRSIRNDEEQTAEHVALTDSIRELLNSSIRPFSNLDTTETHFVATSPDMEGIQWIDIYSNAHRIVHENRNEMKCWLTKVPFINLLDELDRGYIEKISFSSVANRDTIKAHMQKAITDHSPLPLVTAYTESTRFFSTINHDLAKLGSDFRFECSLALRRFGYRDDEAPQGMGQHIFVAILIYHSDLQPYYYAGITFRGMNITPNDVSLYALGKIVMTRSLLSTSKEREVAEIYLDSTGRERTVPVICIYKVSNPQSSLNITQLSKFQYEKEVLILPFIFFESLQSVKC